MATTPLLELRGVSKSFGATRALHEASLSVRAGQAQVIAGANGAGKSTLIRILSGAEPDYDGQLLVGGRPVRFPDPRAAVEAGIATIHQELSLVPTLSIADNLLLSQRVRPWSRVRRSAALESARRVLRSIGLERDPDTLVERLPLSERQALEIARALERDARILILDEPTSALSEEDAERLFSSLDAARRRGAGIVYISHRMDEIQRLGDRIMVLRDGVTVWSRNVSEVSRADIVRSMLGRRAETSLPARARRSDVRLAVSGLSCGGAAPLMDVTFELRSGEVVGVAGLKGAGANTLLHALFGALGEPRGACELDGRRYCPVSPAAALRFGVALLVGDRGESTLGDLSVRHNATLSSLRRFTKLGFVAGERERTAVSAHASEVELKAASLEQPARELSGGNQQKVALLRCLLARPRLLLLDDPTRGIDVGAKADVHALLRRRAAEGTSILIASSELDELCELCDRVIVLARGRVETTLAGDDLTRPRLLAALMGAAT
jgi:ABC-type sugar transport system ATPase subunit